jgi:hypothetical protein
MDWTTKILKSPIRSLNSNMLYIIFFIYNSIRIYGYKDIQNMEIRKSEITQNKRGKGLIS